MGDSTSIEWTDATWNCIRGCSRVSSGCERCYAELIAARFSGPGQPYEGLARRRSNGEPQWTGKVRLVPEKLTEPLRWRRPRRVFVNSMSDLFHEALPDELIDRVFAVMALAPQHTFQVLTKRAERMREYVARSDRLVRIDRAARNLGIGWYWLARQRRREPHPLPPPWPLPNVGLGTSVEDQPRADERIPELLRTPAAVRWISAEPLLGPLNLAPYLGKLNAQYGIPSIQRILGGLDWVVVGGESGPSARPCDVAWIRDIVRQCRAASVPVFVKQDSGPKPGHQGRIPDDLWLKGVPAWRVIR